MRIKVWAWLSLLAAIWGSSFLFMRQTVPEFGAFATAGLRMALGALVLLLALGLMRESLHRLLQLWRPLLWAGALTSSIPLSLWAWAMVTLPAGYASIINATTPLLTALIGVIWLKNSIRTLQIVGIFGGLLGVVALVASHQHLSEASLLPALLGLAATFFYGLSANYTKVAFSGESPWLIAAGSQFYGSLLLLPLVVASWPEVLPSHQAWWSMGALGILATGIAFMIYFQLLEKEGAVFSVSVTYLIQVFGIFWGWLFLDEAIEVSMLLLGLMIVGSTLLVNAKGKSMDGKLK